MQQLAMQARIKDAKTDVKIPEGYRFIGFNGTAEEIAEWKAIMAEAPALGHEDPDVNYRELIENYADCVPTQDIWFIVNENGERVASITTITKSNGQGYVHMVKAKANQRGKGLGHALARYALGVFKARGVESVRLTTDDFRLAAVKTYLDAGFLPVIVEDPDSDMNARWTSVLENLGYKPVERIQG